MAEEISEQKLKDMKLHDDIVLGNGILIKRVVGGWIYWRAAQQESELVEISTSVSIALAGVFVPEPKKPPKQK